MDNNTNPFEDAMIQNGPRTTKESTLMSNEPHNFVEPLLNTLSYILLIIGGIVLLIFFILAGAPEIYDSWFEKFNWLTFAIGIGIALVQCVFFAILQVLRNISIKLNK